MFWDGFGGRTISPLLKKSLLRLLGFAVFAFGAFIGKQGLDQHAERVGGPNSAWIETEAVLVRIEPHPQYEQTRRQIYAVTAPSGAQIECRQGRSADDTDPIGTSTTFWVNEASTPGNCQYYSDNPDAGFTPAHFFMLFAVLWMAMGAAFMIRPPNNIGGGGGGGPF